MAKSTVESSSEVVVGLTEKALIRVLHVDDEAGFLRVAKQCLEMEDKFHVETAVSIEEAKEKMKKKTFDVIVSDYVMPEKNGLQFLKELRDKGNNIPFIIFTGKGREEVAIKALNYGADQYLNKAGDPEAVYGELAHSIRRAVKTRQAERSLQKAHDELERRVKERTAELVKLNEQMKREISERKKAEEAIRESQEKFERLFMDNPEAAVYLDQDSHILDVNPRFSELFGYSLDEVKGRHINDVVVPKGKMEEAKIVDKKALKGYFYHDTARKRKDESLVPVSISGAPITVEDKLIGYMLLYKDITERKRFEEGLSALNTYSRKLNIARDMEEIYRLTLDAMEKTLGFENAAFMVVDKNMLCVVDQRGYPEILSLKLPLNGKRGITVRAAKTGRSVIVPDMKKERDYVVGMPGMRSELDVPVKIGNNVLGVLSVESKKLDAFDEKDQKLLEILASHAATAMSNLEHAKNLKAYAQEIRESQQKFERLFMDNPEAAVYTDSNFRILDTNPRFTELFGYSLDEVKGKHINSVIVPEDKVEEAKTFDKRASKGEAYQEDTVRKRKDGSLVPVSFSAAPIIVENKAIGHVAVYKDISQLKKTEKAIRESQQKFQRLFMNNPEAADYLGPDFHILDVNPRFTELFGYSLDEVKGKHINDVIVPEDKIEEAKMLDKKAGERIVSYDTVRKRKDGSLVSVSISAAPIIVEGKLIGTVGLYKDISQLRKAEETLRDALEKLETVNEKLRVVGRLTRHDVRNKLSAVTGNVYLAKKKLPDDHKAMEHLVEIGSAVRQVEKIFDFARTYERLGVEELAYMDVEKDVEGAVALFSDLQGVKVVNDCRGLTVLADSLLRQLIYNLIDNSLKYGRKVTRIRVYYEEIAKDQLKLVYEDDGVGIPKAEKEKIFKEGYGKGTGYGLYLIRKICEVYGWTIRETGKQGKGAEFTITIPKIGENGKIKYKLH